MRFIQLSDTHIRADYSEVGYLNAVTSPTEKLKRDLLRQNWDGVGFLVLTGDLVHEGEEKDYEVLKEILETNIPKNIEVIYVLGNHDRKAPFYRVFMGIESEKPYYYAEEKEGYRIIVLDSAIPGKESGWLVEEEKEWLKNILKTPSEKGSLIFIHHPVLYEQGSAYNAAIKDSQEVEEILAESDVLAIFNGHTHQRSVVTSGRLVQYTCDSTAFDIEFEGDGIAFTDKTGYASASVGCKNICVQFADAGEVPEERKMVFKYRDFAEALKKLDE